jgi:hypothetical protein
MTERFKRAFDELEAECAVRYFEVQWRLWDLLGRPMLAEFVNVAANAGKSDLEVAGELGVRVEDVRLVRKP